jgi:hypothetical protein
MSSDMYKALGALAIVFTWCLGLLGFIALLCYPPELFK